MAANNLNSQEIRKIVEHFPTHAEEPYVEYLKYTEEEEFVDYICVGEEKFKRQSLFYLCHKGYLDVRFSLKLRPSMGLIEKRWEEEMRANRVLNMLSGGKMIPYPFDSESTPPPKGMDAGKWEEMKSQTRAIYRDFLLSVKSIDKGKQVTLDTRPLPPTHYDEWGKQTDFFPIKKWREREKIAKEYPGYYIDTVVWEVGKTSQWEEVLRKKEQEEIKKQANLSSTGRLMPFPLLDRVTVRRRILACCGPLPESVRNRSKSWLLAKEVVDRIGTDDGSLKTMRSQNADKYPERDEVIPSALGGTLHRDEAGRIFFTPEDTKPVLYWERTVEEPRKFWEENFHPNGRVKRKKLS